ncbi:VPLPA-CTERM sorting domain-containing protein [Pseudodesulfovibrio portus]|uniref:Ice-binding protein C-terminal domain-containing protein n=1 Tax=Pseudodesulfovibrio portus TaxID=231439 RepID=A0ABM8AU88_9BACT|nr:VPLPA-CTERM sorting domain-containing protein [Pseudodesulfovibrio portus]BDQ34999.1 hypothetical protein JCM14722_25410 [Pseudodesulfovibrio portus]
MKVVLFKAILFVLAISSYAHAGMIVMNADNAILGFSIDGVAVSLPAESSLGYMGDITTLNVDLDPTVNHVLTWNVHNTGGPIGFLGKVVMNGGETFFSDATTGMWETNFSGTYQIANIDTWNGNLSRYMDDSERAAYGDGYWVAPGSYYAADMLVSFSYTAPTPLPGAVWLLGSGLIGFVGLRRKMNA